MAVEPAQINLADLLAGRTEKHQPRTAGSNPSAEPQMKPELAALGAPAVPDCDNASCISLSGLRDSIAGSLFEHVEAAFVRAHVGIMRRCGLRSSCHYSSSVLPTITYYVSDIAKDRLRMPSHESSVQRIVVLGGGFAGLWSAIGAARALDERGMGPDRVQVTVMNATRWHCIRVRNYEADLSDVRVPLTDVLDPIGVRLVVGEVVGISVVDRTVTCVESGRTSQLAYDRIVFALGSRLVRPPIPGLREHTYDVTPMKLPSDSVRISPGWSGGRARQGGIRCWSSARD
jgi:hypothetical protein